MAITDYVFEILMDEYPEWEGNEVYATKDLAEYFGIRDFINTFYARYLANVPAAEEPGEFKWEYITRGLYHLYEDGNPTGVALKFRYVHQEK